MAGLFLERRRSSTRVLPAGDSKHREPIGQGLRGGERQTCSRPNPRSDGNDVGNAHTHTHTQRERERKEVFI